MSTLPKLRGFGEAKHDTFGLRTRDLRSGGGKRALRSDRWLWRGGGARPVRLKSFLDWIADEWQRMLESFSD